MKRAAWGLAVLALCACGRSAPGVSPDLESVQSARAVRAALARATARHWLADVGPTTSEDLASLRKQWVYYARPESVVVEHLIVQIKPGNWPWNALEPWTVAANATARAFAKNAPKLDDSAFADAAQRVVAAGGVTEPDGLGDTRGVDVHEHVSAKFEQLPPIAKDGRIVMPGASGSMVPEFVAAAFALKDGETSAVVATEFGLHVIRRMETYPANMPSDAELTEQKSTTLRGETQKRRIEQGIASLRASARIELNPAADSLMAQLTAVPTP